MKKIEDYIHLYIGCDVIYPNAEGINIIATMTGVSKTEIETTYKNGHKEGDCVGDYLSWKSNGRHNCDASHVKLLLRPLSSMTEEEAKELIQFEKLNREYANVYFKIINGYKGGIVAIEVNYTIVDEDIVMPKVWTFNFCAMNSDDFRHLLSKGFDLFGLIDANLALDATKIENDDKTE